MYSSCKTHRSRQITGWHSASNSNNVRRCSMWWQHPPWCPLAGCKADFTYHQVLGIRKQQQKEWLSAETMQKIEMWQKKKEAVNRRPCKTSQHRESTCKPTGRWVVFWFKCAVYFVRPSRKIAFLSSVKRNNRVLFFQLMMISCLFSFCSLFHVLDKVSFLPHVIIKH